MPSGKYDRSHRIGMPNKDYAKLKLDLLETLREKGFDPVAALVDIHIEATRMYKIKIKKESGFGAIGFMSIARESASDIMAYVYPKLKNIEVTGANGQDFFQSFSQLMSKLEDKEPAIEVKSDVLPASE